MLLRIVGQPLPLSSDEPVGLDFGKNGVLLTVNREVAQALQDSVLRELGFYSVTFLDSCWESGSCTITGLNGWTPSKRTKRQFVFEKTLQDFAYHAAHLKSAFFLLDEEWLGLKGPVNTLYPTASYGVNDFKRQSVFQKDAEPVLFFLAGHQQAREVVLSGSFNAWSTALQPMTPTDSGWILSVPLEPGKYLYKFIVDGHWMTDGGNNLREPDGHGGDNSVFFRYNHRFYLPGHFDDKKVFVAGSFNNWREKELALKRWMGGWILDLYIREGTHRYKFIADKDWILDPNNSDVRDDGMGNANNYFSIGNPVRFQLTGYESASSVFLAGNFNDWIPGDLPMEKTETGWVVDYTVAPGNHGYKFVVDGHWINDPQNPHTDGSGEFTNSIAAIEPNVTFQLPGYANAEKVLLTGSFNGWTEEGYTCVKTSDGWTISLHLEPGKYLYKFIVDGNWILDPGNKLWEQNEYDTGNSVLWVNPQGQAEQ